NNGVVFIHSSETGCTISQRRCAMRTDSVCAAVAAAVLLPCTAAIAAEVKVRMSDLPPAVQGAVKEQSKGATVRGLYKGVGERQNGIRSRTEGEWTQSGRFL